MNLIIILAWVKRAKLTTYQELMHGPAGFNFRDKISSEELEFILDVIKVVLIKSEKKKSLLDIQLMKKSVVITIKFSSCNHNHKVCCYNHKIFLVMTFKLQTFNEY